MKIYLETLGCRLNEAEIEAMARGFAADGHTIVTDAAQADLSVINTCAVTQDAVKTSRNRIRHLARAQPDQPAQVIVTGCYSALVPDQAAALPGVRQIVANADKDRLVPLVLHDSAPPETMDAEPIQRDTAALPGAHGHTRAFIKVQDGCDNLCTFCITRVARGPGRSRSIGEIVAEIHSMRAAGYHEAVLTGVQIGSFGEKAGGLTDLIAAILADTDMPRLRVSSLEPWDLDESFFRLWENPRLCPHLHLPIQSGCESTLRRMRRRTTPAEYDALLTMARSIVPDLALSTDVIVGFPGETDSEFDESRAFIEQIGFMKLHVFPYSPRPGTAATRLPNPIDPKIGKARGDLMRQLSAQAEHAHRLQLVGRIDQVLWENVIGATGNGWINTGLTRGYTRAYWTGPAVLTNTITAARLGTPERDGVVIL